MIDSNILEKAISYEVYRDITNRLLAENKTSGDNHSSFMVDYTRMNVERMNHLDSTTVLKKETLTALEELSGSYIFLVLTESWCGDASQIIPVLDKIAEASKNKIDLKLVWRDENLDLMDQYLTNGGRSIPKLIVLEKETLREIGIWGPRPEVLQELFNIWKEQGMDIKEISGKLHNWYSENKTEAIQDELVKMILSF